MQILKSKFYQLGLSMVVMTIACLYATQSFAADLNVCAGKNEMPFSNEAKEGFENDIAELLGKSMNRKVNFVWWTNAMYMDKDLKENKCDVLLGADANDPRILATNPYYKTGYVFITRVDRQIDIDSWDHPYLKEKNFRIGVMPDSPGKNMLLQINRFDDMFDYFTEIQNFKSTRNSYIRVEPSRLVNDVATQHIHAAMLWAPEAARYVRDSKVPLKMTLIEDNAKKSNGEKMPMHYEVVMGVKKGNESLRVELNKVIESKHSEIDAILKNEGIPLLSLN